MQSEESLVQTMCATTFYLLRTERRNRFDTTDLDNALRDDEVKV